MLSSSSSSNTLNSASSSLSSSSSSHSLSSSNPTGSLSSSASSSALNGSNSLSINIRAVPSPLSPSTATSPALSPSQQTSTFYSYPPRGKSPWSLLQWWYQHRLLSPDRVERHFAFLTAFLVCASILFAMIKSEGPIWAWGAPLCTFWSMMLISLTLTIVWAEWQERSQLLEVSRFVLVILLMLSVLIYYDGSNAVNRYRFAQRGSSMLYDEQLLYMDEVLLGWLYPRGQMALWLDTQKTIGVTTEIGRFIAEFLQIMYISYYFWGNVLGAWLLYHYFYHTVYKNTGSVGSSKGTKKLMQWRRIQMFVTSWVSAFVLNHLINLCFPAVSPRIYLKDAYVNEIQGLWVLNGLRNAVKNAASNTFSAFPSGHCGLSWLALILCYRVQPSKKVTIIFAVAAFIITVATQWLRYHYFVDFLFANICVAFGAWVGGFHDDKTYDYWLNALGAEDHDEDGKPRAVVSPSTRNFNQEAQPLMQNEEENGVNLQNFSNGNDNSNVNQV